MIRCTGDVSNDEESDMLARIHTHDVLASNIGHAMEVEDDCEVIGIIGSVELGDVEEAFTAQTVVEIASIQRRMAIHVKLASDSVDAGSLDLYGQHSPELHEQQCRQGPPSRCHVVLRPDLPR